MIICTIELTYLTNAMKKHIVCNYKNGALLFCTSDVFETKKAFEILEVFNRQHLRSVCEPDGVNRFRIVGKMNLYYDPFVLGAMTWAEVLAKMTVTMDALEKELAPYFRSDLNRSTSPYINLKK